MKPSKKLTNFLTIFLPVLLLVVLVAVYVGARLLLRPVETRVTPGDSRVTYQTGDVLLIIEALDDDLLHFEYSKVANANPGANADPNAPILTTPMIAKTDYPGPTQFKLFENGFQTAGLSATIDQGSLCLTVTDITYDPAVDLTTVCPNDLNEQSSEISLGRGIFDHVYGLGEHFTATNAPDGDWANRTVEPGSQFGNAMTPFSGGNTGNAQFPVMYALEEEAPNPSYALFFDHTYAITWDFIGDPWRVFLDRAPIRGYLLSGPDLPNLRADFMELTGRPPVPPKTMFGLWVSEYGFDNWAEMEEKLASLRAAGFPIDGFVMDLQWFGGIGGRSYMGALTWDEADFPDPEETIARLWDDEGVRLMLIEESYISAGMPEYELLAEKGYMPLMCPEPDCDPIYLIAWWGKGGMVDWTDTEAAAYWHDTKRQPLIDMGIVGHWTDLGEPENFHYRTYYAGFPELGLSRHEDVHNLYNLSWSRSIWNGYARSGVEQRPFIVSRSGTAGIQRYGVSMWSGDIGSNLGSLAAHMNAQMHMSFSGIDYFGSDVGGFMRGALDGNESDMYTRWFANSAMLDIPVRPHTENLCNCKETAPDRIGDEDANLANIRLRYSLIPYLYSLAHRAYLTGEPVMPPLVFYYQSDPNVHEIGSEKMLGPDLLAATVTEYSVAARRVYLPAGVWFDYRSHRRIESSGQWLESVPVLENGNVILPLFARAGAIIPETHVDDQTMNTAGRRQDGTVRDELIIRVFPGADSTFTLYEDDGATMAYQSGAVRTTELSQEQDGDTLRVTIAAAQGTYEGAPASRANLVRLVLPGGEIAEVTLNGAALTETTSLADFEAAESGWYQDGSGIVYAKSGKLDVGMEKVFEFRQ